jgi:hypothetical protein
VVTTAFAAEQARDKPRADPITFSPQLASIQTIGTIDATASDKALHPVFMGRDHDNFTLVYIPRVCV